MTLEQFTMYSCQQRVVNQNLYSTHSQQLLRLINTLLIFLKFAISISLLIVLISIVFDIPYKWLIVLLSLCLFVVFVVFIIIANIKRLSIVRQFAYIVEDGWLLILCVDKLKKIKYKAPLYSIKSFGKYNKLDFSNFKCKVLKFFCNSNSQLYYIVLDYVGQRILMLCEFNDEMIHTLKQFKIQIDFIV
ncbi:MAG: hypothetical protein FWF56_05215 [Firmicutes bacterium]|nr:hypothetical protein [Bacillota bacterium]MCL1953803.1 hypothetical protein [Bacillota bacterium]